MRGRFTSRPGIALSALAIVAAAGSGAYTVRQGDTLSGIAQRHGVGVEQIAQANDIDDPDRIYVGQSLVIPSAESAGQVHVVQPGETLAGIAEQHGIDVQQIVQANGIVDPGLIFAGTRLRLEGPAWSAPPVEGRRTHVVQAEETLSGIALRYGTTVQAIVEANAIPDPSLIVVGTSLEVPSQGVVCPVPGATFFNDWGFVRPGGRFHEGNDLYAPHGTPVLANVSGLVEHLEGPTGGLQYRLYAGDGTTYVGTHLSGFGAAGSVQAGEVIGYVGDSGNARGSRPHLHFEIIPPGSESINPYPLLEKACP